MIFLTTFFNFWRYKMKKTMIAMAVAGVIAAPMASADVSVSGVVEQTFLDNENTTTKGWESQTDSSVTFKAAEDLGNGMTAFAQITLDTDGDTSGNKGNMSGSVGGKDSKVGISGDFGTVVVGRMEDFTESKLAATMSLYGPAGIELAGNAARSNGAIAYVSPTVNGFHVAAAGYVGQSAAGVANTDTFDATDLYLAYANGPLSLQAAVETQNKAVNTGDVDQTTTSVSAKYVVGDLTLSMLSSARDDQAGSVGADSDDMAVRADYVMGNNKITVASVNDDSADNDISAIELSHKFSSRTAAYIGHSSQSVSGKDKTYFGLQHSF